MKFGELRSILDCSKNVKLYDDDGDYVSSITPESLSADTCPSLYDECEVCKLSTDGFSFLAYIEIPTWCVTGTVTAEVSFTVKALSEDDALDAADDIRIDSYCDSLQISYRGSSIEDINIYDVSTEWEDAEME